MQRLIPTCRRSLSLVLMVMMAAGALALAGCGGGGGGGGDSSGALPTVTNSPNPRDVSTLQSEQTSAESAYDSVTGNSLTDFTTVDSANADLAAQQAEALAGRVMGKDTGNSATYGTLSPAEVVGALEQSSPLSTQVRASLEGARTDAAQPAATGTFAGTYTCDNGDPATFVSGTFDVTTSTTATGNVVEWTYDDVEIDFDNCGDNINTVMWGNIYYDGAGYVEATAVSGGTRYVFAYANYADGGVVVERLSSGDVFSITFSWDYEGAIAATIDGSGNIVSGPEGSLSGTATVNGITCSGSASFGPSGVLSDTWSCTAP